MLANGIDMSVPKFKFTKFLSAKTEHGTPYEITWEELRTRPFIPSEDKDGVGSYYGSLEGDIRGTNRYIDLELLVLDIDASPDNEAVPLQEALAKYDYIIESTYSHNPENKNFCYRVLIPFAEKVKAKDYRNVVRNFVNSIPYLSVLLNKPNNKNREGQKIPSTVLDKSCFEPSRFYYHPSVNPDRFGTETRYSNKGMPLIPDTHYDESLDKVSSNMSKTPISDLLQGVGEGSRHNECIRLTGLLLSKDFNVKDTLQFMLGWNERCNPPRDIQEVTDEVYDIAKKYHQDSFLEIEPVVDEEESSYRFRLIDREERKVQEPVEWYIDKLFRHKGVCSIIGQERNGKSFVAVDLACRISRGMDFFGHETRGAKPVIYFALEDWQGIDVRLKGWEQYWGVEADVKVLPQDIEFNFLDGGIKMVKEFVNDLKSQGFEDGVLVFDTFQYLTAGMDENGQRDMSIAQNYLKYIAKELNSLVIYIHHMGKNKHLGSRGSTVLTASMDTRLSVHDNNTLTIEKVKGAKDSYSYTYKTDTVGEGDMETLVITSNAKGKSKEVTGRIQVGVKDFIKSLFLDNEALVKLGYEDIEIDDDLMVCIARDKLVDAVKEFLKGNDEEGKPWVKQTHKIGTEAKEQVRNLIGIPYEYFGTVIDMSGIEYVYDNQSQ